MRRVRVRPDGPWADRKAYDLLIQCEAGVVSLTGSPQAPAKAGISIADIAGGMYAYTGILTALYHRATTGVASRSRSPCSRRSASGWARR